MKMNLKQWREDRHITEAPHIKVYVANVIEELLEMFSNNKNEIDFLKEEIMDTYFNRLHIEKNIIDAIQDIRVFSENQTELMGYDAEIALSETIKEISSREQDPLQKEDWLSKGYDGTKWQKNRNQDRSTLYVADYTKASTSK
jgi:chemotaxis protein histidine kinase CheA